MTRRRRDKPRDPASGSAAEAALTSPPIYAFAKQRETLAERIALLVLLALIPLRAVASETHRFEAIRWLQNLEAPAAPTPALTFAIFAVILAAGLLVVLGRCRRGRAGYQWTGAEPGLVLMILAGGISIVMAGQKHLAVIGVLDFLGLLLYCIVLRQLLTRPWHIRLALTVVLATGAMVVVKCAYQKLVEFPLTLEYYEQRKSELAKATGVDPDDPARSGMLHDYEQRLKAQAVSGYFQHPNVAASYLVLIVLTAASVAVSRWRRGPAWSLAAPLILCAAAAVMLIWTQSKGAAAACMIGLLVWAAGLLFGRRCGWASRPGWMAFALWASVLVGAIGLIGMLKAKPDILGRSLLFRTMYCQGAWRMLADRGPWGVGADNFGRFFPRYKPVECPEDVDDPHSWFAKAACEWGVVGLAGLLLILIGFSWRLARPDQAGTRPSGSGPLPSGRGSGNGVPLAPVDGQSSRSIILWLGGLGAIVFGWWLWQLSHENPNYVAVTLMVIAFPWVIGFALLALDRRPEPTFADDEPSGLLAGLCAGLIAFVLHAGIDLSLFWPATAMTFFAVMAIALAVRHTAVIRAATVRERSRQDLCHPLPYGRCSDGAGRGSDRRRLFQAAAMAVLLAAGIVSVSALLAKPAAQLAAELNVARHHGEPSPWEVYVNSAGYQAYRAGIDDYTLDGTAVAELAEELVKRAATVQHVDQVLDLVKEIKRRDPFSSVPLHLAATAYLRRHQLGGDADALPKAIEAMRKAVEAYPTSPRRRMFLADLLEELAKTTGSDEVRKEAARELQTVLDLDAERIYVSKPHRLTDEQQAAIKGRISKLQQR